MPPFLLALIGIVFAAGLIYWLLFLTEGVFLGWKVVVWLYDITANRYDGIKEFDDEAERLFVSRPLNYFLRQIPTPLVLDVATGTGRLPHYLLNEATFNGRVIGLDASRRMLSLALAKLAPFRNRAAFVQQSAVPLPFTDGQFDAVICLESLEFFPSDRSALREMIRVLRPGALLMVTRRRGWEAKAFLRRYRSREQFEDTLRSLGVSDVYTQPWQVEYDLVYGRKQED